MRERWFVALLAVFAAWEAQRLWRVKVTGVLAGATFALGGLSLWTDWLGQERWAAYCADPSNWAPAARTVPEALLFIVLWAVFLWRVR